MSDLIHVRRETRTNGDAYYISGALPAALMTLAMEATRFLMQRRAIDPDKKAPPPEER